jgi:hypothetical protein
MICADAVVISSLPYTTTVDTTAYTTDPAVTLSCGGGDSFNAAWWVYTPPAGVTRIQVDTIGSDYDTVAAAFTGSCGALTEVGCDDESGGSSTSRFLLDVTPGTTYHFLATSYHAGGGSLTFSVTDQSPAVPDFGLVPTGALGFGTSLAPEGVVTFCSADTGAQIAIWPTPGAVPFRWSGWTLAAVPGDPVGRLATVSPVGDLAIVAGDLTTRTPLFAGVYTGTAATATAVYGWESPYVPLEGFANSYRPVLRRYSLTGTLLATWNPPDYVPNPGDPTEQDCVITSGAVSADDTVFYLTGQERDGATDAPGRVRRYSLTSAADLSDLVTATDSELVPFVLLAFANGDVLVAWHFRTSLGVSDIRRYHADGTLAHTYTTLGAGAEFFSVSWAHGIDPGTFWIVDWRDRSATLVRATTDSVIRTITLPVGFAGPLSGGGAPPARQFYATEVALGAPPTFAVRCPGSRAVDAPTNDPVTVSWPAPATVGGVGPVTVSCTPASGSTFAVGITTVTCTATDSLGHIATCSFHVTVNGECSASAALDLADPCAITTPLYWATVTVGTDVYAHSLGIPIDDRTDWGGYKEGRILSIGPITRAASDMLTGHFEGQSVTLTYADTDRVMRSIPREAHDQPRSTLVYRPVMVYLSGARNQLPRPLFSGEVYNTPVAPHLQFQIVVNDILASRSALFGADQQVPSRRVGDIFPNAPAKNRDLAVPIVYGEVSDEAATTPAGEVVAIDVGDLTVNGNARRGALICGHGVKSILNVYQNGTLIGSGDAHATWPGKSDWLTINGSADHYTDVNDHWVALVLLDGTRATDFAAGTAAITVNLQGVATGGDGSGDLITDLLLQYRHLLINWILTSWTSGLWHLSPTFAVYPDGTPLCRVRTQSWQTASATAGTFVDGGLVGGFVLGADGRAQAAREVIALANKQCHVRLAMNELGQLFVRMLPRTRTAALNGNTTIVDVTDILDTPAFQSDQKIESLATELAYRYRWNYRNRQWDGGGQVGNAPALLLAGRPVVQRPEFPWIRETATAGTVAQQILNLLSETNEIVQWARPLCGLEHELLDVVPLHHFSGRAVEQTVWITRKTIDPMTNVVSFEGISIGRLLS